LYRHLNEIHQITRDRALDAAEAASYGSTRLADRKPLWQNSRPIRGDADIRRRLTAQPVTATTFVDATARNGAAYR
jgi:hypothetical protein